MKEKYKVNTKELQMITKPFSQIESQKIGLPSFTLVELMLVVAVIGILAGIVLAAAGGVQKKAARDQAKAEIQTMAVALEKFRAEYGAYPAASSLKDMTNTLYRSLTNFMSFRTNQIAGTGTNIAVLDPYGFAYRYRSPAVASTTMLTDSFEIFSVGANGQSSFDSGAGSAGDKRNVDDIKSW